MNEQQYLEKNKKGPVIAVPDDVFEPGKYEASPIPADLLIVDKLGIRTDFMIDGKIAVKARGVEEFLRSQLSEEGMRDSTVSFETVLSRLTERLPESLERMVTGKRGLAVLDHLFKIVALSEEKSAQTYYRELEEQYRSEYVDYLLAQLEKALN